MTWIPRGRRLMQSRLGRTMRPMAARLYALPGSHPSVTAELTLQRKGIDYRRLDLVPAVHRPLLRALRFPGITVPALVIDGRRVQGSRTISRALDEIRAEPPLFPADPTAADCQSPPSVGRRIGLDDLRPAMEGRPAGEHALRVCPEFPGRIGPVLPENLLEPLRAAA